MNEFDDFLDMSVDLDDGEGMGDQVSDSEAYEFLDECESF